jgi:hypothetical protein
MNAGYYSEYTYNQYNRWRPFTKISIHLHANYCFWWAKVKLLADKKREEDKKR